MQTIGLLILLCAVAMLFALSLSNNLWRGRIARVRKSRVRKWNRLERLALPFMRGLDLLSSSWHRVWHGGNRIALANELATFNEHGIESLMIDPTSANLPVATRYLLYTRGSSGTGYCDVCSANALPLGVSSDSPYQVGDIVNVRRLGARPGLEVGIPATAFTVDDLVLTAASGKVQTFAGVANGTYWIVGRAAKTTPSTAIEIAYVPCVPIKITVNAGAGTIVVA